MGKKIDKKIKSERLNALRKRYDSFIEEDKKRKERNDFILQRLDKIRYSTSTALQNRPMTVYGEYSQPSYNRFDYRPEKIKLHDDILPRSNQPLMQPNLQLDIPRQFDDISILREISKKYILIPKSQTGSFNNYSATNTTPQENKPIQPKPESNVIDNNDWRSKYDILEQLRKKENEVNINKPFNEDTTTPYKTQFHQPKINDNGGPNLNYDVLPKYEAELPEKDMPSNNFTICNELHALNDLKISDNEKQNFANITQPSSVIESNNNSIPVAKETTNAAVNLYVDHGLEQTANIGNDIVDNNIPSTDEVSYQPPQEQINILYENNAQQQLAGDGLNQTNEYQNYANEYEQHEPIVETSPYQEKEFNIKENDYSSTRVENPAELVQELNIAPGVDVNKFDENIEYPIDIINVQDFTPGDNVELQDGVNINPEYIASNQELNLKSNEEPGNEVNIGQQNVVVLAENVTDNEGIEAFDAEQKEMLYNYDQEGAGEPYDPEYVPSQDYQPNTDYNYYEGDQQDAYPIQINEHEETSERYDPNYEQQFGTSYDGYVEQEQPTQQYEQPIQQYEEPIQQNEQSTQEYQEPALYKQIEQGYEQYSYEQENQNTTQDVQRVLDREDGYEEPNPEVKQAVQAK